MKDRTGFYLSAALILTFVILALAVTYSMSLDVADLQAALWVNHLPLGSAAASVLSEASLYGREYFWIPVVGIMLLVGDRRTKLVALGLCGVFVAGIAAGEIAKAVIARSRPDQFLATVGGGSPIVFIPLDTDFSFPSGHALIVAVGAAYSLLTFRSKLVAALLTLEAAVVCFSRVFTFEHFPTDVAAGVILGSAIANGGLVLGRRYLSSQAAYVADVLVRVFRDGPLKL